MKISVQDPLREDSCEIPQQFDIASLLLCLNSGNLRQSAHLVSIIDMTQDKQVEARMVAMLQDSQIDTSQLILRHSKIETESSYPKPIIQQPFSNTQSLVQKSRIFNINTTQLSKSVTYDLTKCSFQLLIKKQQEKQKQMKQQPSYLPKQHQCTVEQHINKYTPPIKYRSVSSHYSPQRLQQYLNKNEPGLQENKRWLKTSSHNRTTLQISSKMTENELQTNFKKRNKSQELALKHLSLATSIK